MQIPSNVLNTILNSKNVAIYAHKRPDGDCLGSASALKGALLQLGKKVDLFCDGELSQNYLFIKHLNQVNKPSLAHYDLAIAVDCSDEGRLGAYAQTFLEMENSVKIDHHKTQVDFAKINYVKTVGSTCEILFYLIKQLGVKIDSDIACALYAGVSSDTGMFMHNSTTSQTHQIAAELMEIGFDLDTANYNLFKRKTLGQVGLLKKALYNMQIICESKVAISFLTLRDFKEMGCKNTETFGIVDTLVNIDSVQIGVLISEDKPGLYACSFRSKGKIDVSVICGAFGGGGHVNASGCNIFGGYRTAIEKIEKVINDYYARLS